MRALLAWLGVGLCGYGIVLYAMRAHQDRRDVGMAESRRRNAELLDERLPHLRDVVEQAAAEIVAGVAEPKQQGETEPKVAAAQEGTAIPQAVASDDEWAAFPRSKSDVARKLALVPERLAARDLFRHVALNPQDRYIPEQRRAELVAILTRYGTRLAEARKLETKAAATELETLITAGAARSNDMGALAASLAPDEAATLQRIQREIDARSAQAARERGEPAPPAMNVVVPTLMFRDATPHSFTVRNGKLYSAELRELPCTAEAANVRGFLVIELAGEVTTYFRDCAGLRDHEQITFLERVTSNLDRETKGAK